MEWCVLCHLPITATWIVPALQSKRRGSTNSHLIASPWQERLHLDGLAWSREGRFHETPHEGIDQGSRDPTPAFHLIQHLCPQKEACQEAGSPHLLGRQEGSLASGQMLGDKRTSWPWLSHLSSAQLCSQAGLISVPKGREQSGRGHTI